MKKLVLALVAVLLFAVALIPNVAVAKADARSTQDAEIYGFVEELCEYNVLGKDSARLFIRQKFDEALGGVYTTKEQKFKVGDDEFVNLVVEVTQTNATHQIVIGAHYDTLYEGAGDNACGVAALYMTMKALVSNLSQTPYNFVFVAFDGEENGLLGSQYYVNNMGARAESTVLMFNFDTIATGDNLYLFCENKPTDLAKLILSKTDGIVEKPHAKGTFNIYDPYGYGYYEMVQGSDHTPFRLAGIPTAFFFSGTYSASVWNYAESVDSGKEVMNSPSDTFENLVKNHPDFVKRIATVSNAVVNTVTSEEFFSDVAGRLRKQLVNLDFWYNVLWPAIAAIVIGIVAVVLGILYHRKLQKNALLGNPEIKNQTVFDKPKAEDIFSYKSDDSDDIFTYKK